MSRTKADVVRSLKRHLANFLDDDYNILIEPDDTVWDRPSAIIDTAPQIPTGGKSVMEIVMPISLFVYPEEKETGELAKIEAMRVEEQLIQAFRVGDGVARPCRIPLFDYDGVLVTEPLVGAEIPLTEEEEEMEEPPDPTFEDPIPEGMIWLLDFNTDTRRDPEDAKLQTVLAEGRVRWNRPGETRKEAPEGDKGLKIGTAILT